MSEKGSIIIAGNVSNRGITNLKGGSIRQTSDTAVVSGSTVALAGASIGSKTEPIRVQLLGESGLLAAQASGDVSIRGVDGDMLIGWISTSMFDGNVWLDAEGDIVNAGFGIFGSRIELVSRAGSIGTAEVPVSVQVGDGSQAGLVAAAPGDIRIRQGSGDLRLIRVESLGGDVTLEALDGSIIDVNPAEQKDTRTIEELNRLWDEMLPIENEGAEKSAENTIKAYKQAKEYEYLRYWGMRSTTPQYDENGSFLGYTWDSYDPDHADPEYHRLHQLYGAAEFDPDWEYIVSAKERNALTEGVSWTRDELTMALSGGILFKQTTSTETVYREPNVKGRNVTLKAPKGSVGADRGEVVIDGSNPNELKDETKRTALAAAEQDDVAVDNDTKQITVLLRKPVNVAATGEVIVAARDNVYLSSREQLNVRTISSASNGSVRIKGKHGIYTVSTSGSPVIQGGRTMLEGGDGGLGTSSLPLILQLQAGATLTARAGQSIYIRQASGNLHLAEIYSVGDVNLVAPGSILDSRGNRPLTVMGHGVNLTAQTGSVGEESNPLAVATAPDGWASVSALSGNVYLRASSTILNIGSILAPSGTTSITGQNVEDIRVRSITARTLNIVAGSRILQDSPGVLRVSDVLTLCAGIIDIADLMHTGTAPLQVSAGGITGMADSVTIRASSDAGLRFSILEASNSVIVADADNLKLDRVLVGSRGRADISNRYLTVVADNSGWTLHDCDVQLRPSIIPFYLYITGDKYVETNAEIVNSSSGVRLIIPKDSNPTSLVAMAEEAVLIGSGPIFIASGAWQMPLQGFGQPVLGVVTVQPGSMSGETGDSDERKEEY
jgi:hypothetical protein